MNIFAYNFMLNAAVDTAVVDNGGESSRFGKTHVFIIVLSAIDDPFRVTNESGQSRTSSRCLRPRLTRPAAHHLRTAVCRTSFADSDWAISREPSKCDIKSTNQD